MRTVLRAVMVSMFVFLFIFPSLVLVRANPFSSHPYFPQISISKDGIQYYSSNGAIAASEGIISHDGNNYYLTKDITGYCIDGNNHSINCGNALLEYGIAIQYHYNVTVKDVKIHGFNYGIGLLESNDCTISTIIINNSNNGIHLEKSNSNQLSNSDISNNNYGVFIEFSNSNLMLNSLLMSNQNGLYIFNSQNNVVAGNTIENSNLALSFEHAQEASLSNALPSNNLFDGNNFDNNSQQVSMKEVVNANNKVNASYANDWDYNKQGNYWSDYGKDGVYVIDQNNIDHHPLNKQVDINTTALIPAAPLNVDTVSSLATYFIIASMIVAFVIIASLIFFIEHRKNQVKKV